MTTLILTLLKLSITASYIAVAAVLFRLIFKKAPKLIRMVLWGLVAVRLILPFSFESPVSVLPANETHTPAVVDKALNEFTAPADYTEPVTYTETEPEAAAFAKDDTIQKISTEYKPSFTDIAAVVWFVGFVGMLVYAAVSYIILHRRVAESIPLERRIYSCDKIASPFILGIFRPRIYLPSGLADIDRQNVLLHENMHIKHGDHLIKPFAYLLLAVYWFNPVIWLSYILLCRDIELICDERVIRAVGADIKKSYSESLLNLSVKRAGIAICPLAFGEVSTKQRVKNVLGYKKSAVIITICAAVVCIAVAVCLLTVPRTADIGASDTTEAAAGSDTVVEKEAYMHVTELQCGVYAPVTEYASNPWRDYSQLLYCVDENMNLLVGCPNGTLSIGKLKDADELQDDTNFKPDYINDVRSLTYTDFFDSSIRDSLPDTDRVDLCIATDVSTAYAVLAYTDGTVLFMAIDQPQDNILYAAHLAPANRKMSDNKLDTAILSSYDKAIDYLSENGAVPPFADNYSEFSNIYTDDLYEEYIHATIDLGAFRLFSSRPYFYHGDMVTTSFLYRAENAICGYYGIGFVQVGAYTKLSVAHLYRDMPDRVTEIGILDYDDNMNYMLLVKDSDRVISAFPMGNTHACYDTYYLYDDNMLIEYNPYVSSGIGEFRYNVFQLNNNGNLVLPETVDFSPRESITFRYDEYCEDENRKTDFPQVTAFLEKLDTLLGKSVLLYSTDYGVLHDKVFN